MGLQSEMLYILTTTQSVECVYVFLRCTSVVKVFLNMLYILVNISVVSCLCCFVLYVTYLMYMRCYAPLCPAPL